MTSLMDDYEHQYSVVTAEVTAKIGQVSHATAAETRQQLCREVEQLIADTRELLEQMELETRNFDAVTESRERTKYSTRLESYRGELRNLEKDLKAARISLGGQDRYLREQLLRGSRTGTEDLQASEDMRAKLLDNTEMLDRGSRRLEEGRRLAAESEAIGATVLEDLHGQRETIQHARERMRETDSMLGKSSRVLSGMFRRVIQNRILLALIVLTMLGVVVTAIYFAVNKSQS